MKEIKYKTRTYNIYSLNDVKSLCEYANNHFFDSDTMKFFKSRVSGDITIKSNEVYFITSEQFEIEPRRYTIRKLSVNKDYIAIDTIGNFQEYKSLYQAKKAIEDIK